MIVTKLTVPVAMVVSIIIASGSAVYAADHYFAKISDIKEMAKQQSVRDSMQWLALLEIRLKDAKTPDEKEVILREMEITRESMYKNMGNTQ